MQLNWFLLKTGPHNKRRVITDLPLHVQSFTFFVRALPFPLSRPFYVYLAETPHDGQSCGLRVLACFACHVFRLEYSLFARPPVAMNSSAAD